ncbi:MAG: rod shape-determining protein MreD [Bacteroidales bacterium]|nr:rod shape-determining protein MreD [Bacteroidales bacterium]
MNRTLLNIIRFVVLVIAQVLIVNNIRLGGFVHPYIYLIFVMLLPINMPGWQLLISGFGIGLVIDLFMGTLGMHAGATTLMAFCRPAILKLVSGTQKFENIKEPNVNQLGFPWFIRYTLCMVTIHNFTLFMLEGFSFHLVGQALLRILISVPVSMFLILLILYLFSSTTKKKEHS